MKRPNFFVIGAAKCGTTSLTTWLNEHQNVFVCSPKEPGFFDTDLGRPNRLSVKDYERLFANASDEHIAVGEGSTGYIRSKIAVQNILSYNRDARFIVCLRNPVDMAISLHSQLLREGTENISSFEQAWGLQETRRNGKEIPFFCDEPTKLQYGNVCKVGTQLERLLRMVPRERVHIVLFDDMVRSPVSAYEAVLSFLDVPYDGRTIFSASNPSRTVPRWMSLAMASVREAKRIMKINGSLGLLNGGWMDKRFSRKNVKNASPYLTACLQEYFLPEINILENLLKRDLSHWTCTKD